MPDHEPAVEHNPRHVFVYGTLRRGGSNDIARYRPTPRLLGSATVGGTLYDFGAYPGLRLTGAGRVAGEIYQIDPTVEPALDRLEGIRDDGTGEYLKRAVRVLLSGGLLDCLIYEIHPDRIAAAPVISSGDWLLHAAGGS